MADHYEAVSALSQTVDRAAARQPTQFRVACAAPSTRPAHDSSLGYGVRVTDSYSPLRASPGISLKALCEIASLDVPAVIKKAFKSHHKMWTPNTPLDAPGLELIGTDWNLVIQIVGAVRSDEPDRKKLNGSRRKLP